MKKMRLFYTILIGLIVFSSCTNNDNSERNNDIIIGKWRTIEIYESNEPVSILSCTSEYFKEFKSNKTVAGFIGRFQVSSAIFWFLNLPFYFPNFCTKF
jgi:hypothetical protein